MKHKEIQPVRRSHERRVPPTWMLTEAPEKESYMRFLKKKKKKGKLTLMF